MDGAWMDVADRNSQLQTESTLSARDNDLALFVRDRDLPQYCTAPLPSRLPLTSHRYIHASRMQPPIYYSKSEYIETVR